MKIGKKYYVIYRKYTTSQAEYFNPKQVISIVEDEYIAKDFCKKNYNYDYYEDTYEIEEIRDYGQD